MKKTNVAKKAPQAKAVESIGMASGWGLNQFDREELEGIEQDIKVLHTETEATLKLAFISFGALLCEARTLLKDDTVFGDWRKERTPFESKETANKAMQLHRAINDGRITDKMVESDLGQSHLLEIKDAPATVLTQVEELLDSGTVPTIKAIRAMKKESTDNQKAHADKHGQDIDLTQTDKTPEVPSYSNGYDGVADDTPAKGGNSEKPAVIADRSYEDLVLDELNLTETLLGDVLESTALVHKLAETGKDKETKMWINEIRIELKSLMGRVSAKFDEIEITTNNK